MKSLLAISFYSLLLLGCSTTRHTVYNRLSPVPVETVKLVPLPIFGEQKVGIIMIHSSGKGQRAIDRAEEKAKIAAAKLGANTILIQSISISRTMYSWFPVDDTLVTYEASFAAN